MVYLLIHVNNDLEEVFESIKFKCLIPVDTLVVCCVICAAFLQCDQKGAVFAKVFCCRCSVACMRTFSFAKKSFMIKCI